MPDAEKEKYLSEINIGVNKSDTEEFLKFLEFTTRPNFQESTIELKEVPPNTPHHLDDENDYFGWPMYSFNELKIVRNDKSFIKFSEAEKTAEIHLTLEKTFELFSRFYICNVRYATIHDNVIKIDLEKENSVVERDLVVWGVFNENPIYY